jgi:4-diphosphocytidyl-2-C-methyl-D-erythritol kinase
MVVFPNAKINLGLTIVSKREDGFHNLETIFYPIQWKDVLEIIESDKLQFQSSGIEIPGSQEHNLCLKAYQLIKTDFDVPPVKIHLHKNIPIGAGLGGGSADAAFMLNLLNQKFELNISTEKLQNYARKLGSDCAFFVKNKPVFAKEKGDVFENIELDLKAYKILMVYPNVHVSTADAYGGCKPRNGSLELKKNIQTPLNEWNNNVFNDFELTVFSKFPLLQKIKNQLIEKGAIYASMSGSGSTIFGIFENQPDLDFFTKQGFKVFLSE